MVKIILLLFKIINKFSKGCCGKKKKKKKQMLLKSINIILTAGRGTERSFQVLC